MDHTEADSQLKKVAESYDRAVDAGRNGIDLYRQLPYFITEDPDYPLFEQMREQENLSDSGRKEIYQFLAPKKNMNCIDLGCCLNLLFRGYDTWESTYHGVDISPKTIEVIQAYADKKNIRLGSVQCCSMHDTPFADNYFDIGTCIGSLEYFEKAFIVTVLAEIHRILKPEGKFVLDIPDVGSPEFAITAKIEAYLGRPDTFNMTRRDFEKTLKKHFTIAHKEKVGPMIQYFLAVKGK